MVFETIWNCREIDEISVTKACIVTGFETFQNCRKMKMKRFGIAERNENKDGKLSTVTGLETAEKNVKQSL